MPPVVHCPGVGVTAKGVGTSAVAVGLAMGIAVGMMRVGNGVGSVDLRNVWGPTKLRRKLNTITMLKIAVMIFAPRLLRFLRVYLERLNLPSRHLM